MYCLALVALIHVILRHTIILMFDWMCCLHSPAYFCLTSALRECLESPDRTHVAGHSCWGILNGPATGLVMAELIAEGKASSVDIRRLDPQRLA